MKVAGVILAGGQSRRMGGTEKSLMELQGASALEWIIRRFGPQVEKLAINANGDPSRFGFTGLPVIADTIDGFAGPLAGVLAGMRWAKTPASGVAGVTHLMTAAADTPFIPDTLVRKLMDSVKETQPDSVAMAASNGRIHPVFGLWPVTLADDLEHFLVQEDQRKILVFANRYPLQEITFGDGTKTATGDPFFNINTPEDLIEAKRLAGKLD